MRALSSLSITALVLGVASLFIEQAEFSAEWLSVFVSAVDYSVLALTLVEVLVGVWRAPVKRIYFRQNWPSLLFVLLFVTLFTYSKGTVALGRGSGYLTVLIIRNLFLLLKVFTRIRKLSSFVTSVVNHPAQTIALSFILVIAVGTLLLMMQFTTVDGRGLPFVDAMFTTTSAVCVTGLVVVDTATVFTTWGQVVILMLIQIGGLGIMILSFFTIFVFRQSVSVESKLLISYMLSENNMTTLSSALRRIILITFAIELAGALLLLPQMVVPGSIGLSLFGAVFHSISAFCNAGFALYSNSLEGFAGNVGVNLVIGVLIIAGGLSFAVISNSASVVRDRLAGAASRRSLKSHLSVNTRAVLIVTGGLLVVGTLLFYGLEHHRSLVATPTGVQYLAAFFQSITLRTAGFNTVPLGGLTTATYLVMMALMFVGGASGSTAGGIKVNTVAVIGGYLRSRRRGRPTTVLFNHTVRESQVAAAFTVLVFGVLTVGVGSVILSLSDPFSLTQTMFEAVSAFATVGLTTGITGNLSVTGRVVVIIMMFIGRVGPLTLFSAFSARRQGVSVSYPTADISVG